MKLNLFWVPVTVFLLMTGCATQHSSKAYNITDNKSQKHVLELKAANNTSQTVPEQLTMGHAMALALRDNPSLSGFSAEIRALDAAALQAGLYPNPELDIEIENFGGKDALQGTDGAEATIAFSQLVELGGKRKNRQRVSNLDKSLAESDYLNKKLDILAATSKAFVEVLIAQEQVLLNIELVKLSEQTTIAVSEKVDAGKVSPVVRSRAQIELATAKTEANKMRRELEAAKYRLAKFWGSEYADFDRVIGQLSQITALPNKASLKPLLKNNPALSRWATEMEQKKAALSIAYSEAVPDLTVSVGVRNFQETNDNAFLVGVSIPIPLFNRNQGGISEARAHIDKAQSEQREAKIDLLTDFSDTWQTLSANYTEAMVLRDEILPSAQATYQSTELGYREGKLDFLQMLDAQRTLFTVKRQYLLSLGAYHLASIDMERLVGIALNDITLKNINESEEKEFQNEK